LDVGEHSFERRQVTVYVGDDGDPHWITCRWFYCEWPLVVPSSVPDPSAPILSSLPICGRHLPPLAVPRTHSPIYGYDNRYLMARANQPSDYDKINGGFVKSTADH
jgi:hypothetical protein